MKKREGKTAESQYFKNKIVKWAALEDKKEKREKKNKNILKL